ncbi:Hypothetical_protein [Hexamita inflata]|uniref:Hypothetical_protein n=1 Tax=Hexamita inflata TaxID=28002 RepID=A0AA86RM71_9EUKA|nr:Hypothetical protein HINF_LOCUS64781 [Hexamita inflata]
MEFTISIENYDYTNEKLKQHAKYKMYVQNVLQNPGQGSSTAPTQGNLTRFLELFLAFSAKTRVKWIHFQYINLISQILLQINIITKSASNHRQDNTIILILGNKQYFEHGYGTCYQSPSIDSRLEIEEIFLFIQSHSLVIYAQCQCLLLAQDVGNERSRSIWKYPSLERSIYIKHFIHHSKQEYIILF